MPSNEEVAALIYRLQADTSGYVKAMQEAVRHTEDAAGKVEDAGKKIESFTTKVTEGASKAKEALASIGIGIGLMEAFERFDKFDRNVRHMTATIEMNTAEVTHTIEEYRKFADEMNEVSDLSKGAVMGVLKQAESFGLTGEVAQKATKDAIGLAAATDGSAEAMVRLTAAMAEGNTEKAMRFARMVPQLRGINDEAQFTEKYMKLVATGMRVAAGDAEDATGKLEKMKEKLGLLTKDLGKIVSDVLEPLIEATSHVVGQFNKMDASSRELVVGSLLLLAAIKPLMLAYGLGVGVVHKLVAGYMLLTTWTRTVRVETDLATGAQIRYNAATKAGAIITGGAAVGAFVGAVAAIGYGIHMLAGGREAWANFNNELERSKKLSDELQATKAKENAKVAEGAKYMDDAEKLKYFNDQLHQSQVEAQGAERNLKSAIEAFNKTSGFGNRLARNIPLAGRGKTAERDAARQAVLDAQKNYEQAKQHMDNMQAQADRAKDAFRGSPVLALAFTGLTVAMDEAVIAQAKLHDEADKFSDTLEARYNKAIGISNDLLQIQRLREQGLSEDKAVQLDRQLEEIELLEKHNKLLDKGKGITDEFRNPQEKFNDRIAELNEVLSDGAISWETYTRATKKAQEDYDAATNGAKQLNKEVGKLDSALSGSNEAKARIEAFKQLVKGPTTGFAPLNTSAQLTGPIAASQGPNSRPGLVQGKDAEKVTVLLQKIADNTTAMVQNGLVEVEEL